MKSPSHAEASQQLTPFCCKAIESLINEILQTRQGHALNPAGKSKLTVKDLVSAGRRY